MSLLLQIFLLVNVFLIGAAATIAIQHAYAHYKDPHEEPPEKPEKVEKPRHPQQKVHLPTAVREHLLQESEANFQSVLNNSAAELDHNLKATSVLLNNHLEKLGSNIISDEMKRYHANLEKLRKQAEDILNGAQSEIAEHQKDLNSKFAERQAKLETELNEKIADEKKFLIEQIDTKLSDAVASFLTETLGHNVDLGAQTDYLISMLEEHKSEFTKGIADET